LKAAWLDRVSLNVSDLGLSVMFYVAALGFVAEQPLACADPELARLLGVRSAQVMRLRRGSQVLELVATDPLGASLPPDSRGNDSWFQHCALATEDVAAAHARLCGFAFTPISSGGPVLLPGGIAAFKFRDRDFHPLELIQLPRGALATRGGIDHSAIVVADVARSVAFYAGLGLRVGARQLNEGPAQDALDGLSGVAVDVVALQPQVAAPHVELLFYRRPAGRVAGVAADAVGASRLVFRGDAEGFFQDPDGHWVRLERADQPALSPASLGSGAE
jgi:catechol 2,3-dioxygenase-like lactoylglutathione lyase family enzyme